MIKHIVMIKLKEGKDKKENAIKLKNNLEALTESIPGLLKMEVGLNISGKPSAYDLVLTSKFNNPDDLDKYRVHPEHVKVVDFLKKIVENIAVVDYEMLDA
ncbi:MAG: Dabb family protein [Bacteroidales bacterium]|nr:Dabb family protein [Bacteroidales bacterium]